MWDQGGPPVLADVGQLDDFEPRLVNPRFRNKFGDRSQGFGRDFIYETGLVSGDDDTPESISKGGRKCSQLLGRSASATWGYWYLGGLTLSRFIKRPRELHFYPMRPYTRPL